MLTPLSPDAIRLIWLELDARSRSFLLAQARRHAAHDHLAAADRIAHHATLWYHDACGPYEEAAAVWEAGAAVTCRPIGIAADERVEALVVEVLGHRHQLGSLRLLHITLSLAPGVLALESNRLLAGGPVLTPVGWRDLAGTIVHVPHAPLDQAGRAPAISASGDRVSRTPAVAPQVS